MKNTQPNETWTTRSGYTVAEFSGATRWEVTRDDALLGSVNFADSTFHAARLLPDGTVTAYFDEASTLGEATDWINKVS